MGEESLSELGLDVLLDDIKRVKLYRTIGYILIPVIIGLFILKYCKRKIEEIEEKIRIAIQEELEVLRTKHETVVDNDTYLIWSDRTHLENHFENTFRLISNIKSYDNFFGEGLNDFIEKSLTETSNLRSKIFNFNKEFVNRRKKEYAELFKINFDLDENQKEAIIKDDKYNQIIAGAGSGKTEVLTTRVAYLIKRRPDTIKPDRILALAYQNDACEEMKKRLKGNFGVDVTVKTFHALGKEILNTAELPNNVNGSGKNYEKKFKEKIKELYEKAEEDTGFKNEIINFLKMKGSEEVEVKTEFGTKEEKEDYYEYMRNLRYRTLDDTAVKSLGERVIMNFYLTHKIKGKDMEKAKDIVVIYEEEAPWTNFIRVDESISYPDFYIRDYDIWHEHWTIDDKNEKSKVPEWYEKSTQDYSREMKIKRSRFNELKQTLIETYAYESQNEKKFIETLKERLLEKLTEKYPNDAFEITQIEHDELIEKVWRLCKKSIDGVSEHISRFIVNSKIYGFLPEDIEKRLQDSKWSPVQNIFGRISNKIYREYEKWLNDVNKIDFEAMINDCIKVLQKREMLYQNKFDHILIDEYQDISKQRHILIETLMKKNPKCKLFCVGDDWQSIMSFAGSDLQYFVNFDEYFPHSEKTILPTNYRNIKSIVDAGAEIIKKNSGLQIDKDTYASNGMEKKINVYISEHKAEKKNIRAYYDQITGHCVEQINGLMENGYSPTEDILLLSRIRKNQILNERIEGFADKHGIPFYSVHKSKGLQSRAVFILDFKKGLYGFPCELESPKLLEPSMEKKSHSKIEEERRLFYVALTRAKEDVFIYSQKDAESRFLNYIKPFRNYEELNYKPPVKPQVIQKKL